MTLRTLPLIIGLVLLLSMSPARAEDDKPSVYAVVYPLAYFAERLAGDAAEVVFPVPADTDPAFWRPSIAEIAAFQRADLILLNGADYAQWVANTSLPRSALIDTSRSLTDRFIATESVTHSHGADGEHSHTGRATTLWLDFDQAAVQARAVADALGRVLPEPPTDRLAELEADLADLDARARALPDGLRLIASHPRYQYLARRYDLTIESLEWDAGTTPDADDWAELDELLADFPADAFLWEAEPTSEAAQGLAERGLTGVVFETGANRPADGDFLSLMRANLDELEQVLTP